MGLSEVRSGGVVWGGVALRGLLLVGTQWDASKRLITPDPRSAGRAYVAAREAPALNQVLAVAHGWVFIGRPLRLQLRVWNLPRCAPYACWSK